ncbi:BEM_collapsed_G0049750.mRNA.1.CDS.1 [Saccharomyces cerevisiae]|nr:BEM_collapsed_G0049750.mRNA.1.CDS.1 [Saccharomyces cerevisiae]
MTLNDSDEELLTEQHGGPEHLPQEKPEERKEQDEGDGQEHKEFIPTFTKELIKAEPVSQFKLIEDSDNDIDHAKDVDVNQLEEEVSKSDTQV